MTIRSLNNLLVTFTRVFGLGFVLEFLPDEAAQTQNQHVILIPYYVAFNTWLVFLTHLPVRNRRKREGCLHGEGNSPITVNESVAISWKNLPV